MMDLVDDSGLSGANCFSEHTHILLVYVHTREASTGHFRVEKLYLKMCI